MICKKNKLTLTRQKNLTHTRQTYQTIYTQWQNLEYTMYTSKRLDEESDGLNAHAPVRRGTGCGRTSSNLHSKKVLILVQIKVKFIKPMYITTLERDSNNSTI